MILPSCCEPCQRRTQHSAGPFAPPNPAGRLPELKQKAIHTPGHTPGHLSLYRRSDGVVITGDPVVTVDLNSLVGVLTGRPGVFGPARYSTWDWAAAQRSIAALAALEPRVLATGHGGSGSEMPQTLHALAGGQHTPARWRQGLFAGVDYSGSDPLPATPRSTSGCRSGLVRS
jgi:glyoxylase-like metal-dependent hydrolase (beta-lactamase superfamily II)